MLYTGFETKRFSLVVSGNLQWGSTHWNITPKRKNKHMKDNFEQLGKSDLKKLMSVGDEVKTNQNHLILSFIDFDWYKRNEF